MMGPTLMVSAGARMLNGLAAHFKAIDQRVRQAASSQARFRPPPLWTRRGAAL
jgi:hypothetical protein